MTNKEIADRLEQCPLKLRSEDVDMIDKAIDRLRELPDPTPEPIKDLRWLVERHECLSKHLKHDGGDDGIGWKIDNEYHHMHTDKTAMRVVRGIVKAKCDERRRLDGGSWGWRPLVVEYSSGKVSDSGQWIVWGLSCMAKQSEIPTELEAIDALLTAMKSN